jgi:hypothetical protein
MARRKLKGVGGALPAKLRRMNFTLGEDQARRIGAYARWRGETIGQVVARAVETEMSACRFTVYTGSQGGAPGVQPGPSPAPPDGPESPQDRPAGVPVRSAG